MAPLSAPDEGSCIWDSMDVDPSFPGRVLGRIAYPVFVKDREFRFVVVNDALADMVGRPRSAMLGKTDFDIFPQREAESFRQRDGEVFASGTMVAIEEEVMADPTGRIHVLATTRVPLRNAAGEITHLVGVIHEITHLKEVEEALRLAKEELEERVAERTAELKRAQQQLLRKERLAVLGQLAGGLAHQLRNPLASISNAACVIEKRLPHDERADSTIALSIIKEEILAANQIITDLLDYARVRRARPSRVVLIDLVDAAMDAQVVPTGVAVERKLPDDLEVLVDADQLRHALRNLIRNAFEAMPRGGRLTVFAEVKEEQLIIDIRDTGIGIPKQMRAHLFDPLVSSKQFGLGLGLTTARALVENQGGTLTCMDAPEGAVFQILMPAEVQVILPEE